LAVVNEDDTAYVVRLLLQSDGGGVLDERLTVESGAQESVGAYELHEPRFESTGELLAETEAGAAREFAVGMGGDTVGAGASDERGCNRVRAERFLNAGRGRVHDRRV
jgi:hypothetical protein